MREYLLLQRRTNTTRLPKAAQTRRVLKTRNPFVERVYDLRRGELRLGVAGERSIGAGGRHGELSDVGLRVRSQPVRLDALDLPLPIHIEIEATTRLGRLHEIRCNQSENSLSFYWSAG